MRQIEVGFVVRKLCSVLNGIAGVILALLVVLLVFNIFGRLLKHPILGTYEAVQYGFALIVCLAIAFTALEGKHIDIDLIFQNYPPKVKLVLEIMGELLAVGLLTIVTWRLCVDGVEAYELGEVSSTLGIPVFLFQFALAIGFALLGLVILLKFLQRIGVR